MEASIPFLAEQLKSKGIRPSVHRLKVLEYLYLQGGHPTVDQIFSALSPDIPSLSRVTIYNTLHTFVQAGLVRTVDIDEAQAHYDITLNEHGHFLCIACGTIYNFPVSMQSVSTEGLKEFRITQKNIYFKGLCPNCIDQPITSEQEKGDR